MIKKNEIVMTIDLEDWFHSLNPDPGSWKNYERRVESPTLRLLELFESFNCKATFFVLGDAAVNHPALIRHIFEKGHEIGSHSFNHNFIYNHTASEFRDDLKKSKDVLSTLINREIISFRAPYFSITNSSLWAFDILTEEGFKYDSSVFPVLNHRYGIPGFRTEPHVLDNGLWEFPITVYRSVLGNIPFAGGVYFRFYPLALTRLFIHKREQSNLPTVLYFHPWEFDPGQPRIDSGSGFLNFRHYYNLGGNFEKIKSLLSRQRSISLSEYFRNLSDE